MVRFVMLVLALAFAGCVRSDWIAVGETAHAPRPDDYDIAVFVPLDAPVQVHKAVADPKPMAELPANAKAVGRIDTTGAPAASWGSMIEKAKKQARKIGGDAIIVGNWDSPVTAVNTYGQAYGNSYSGQSYAMRGKALVLTVVRYRD